MASGLDVDDLGDRRRTNTMQMVSRLRDRLQGSHNDNANNEDSEYIAPKLYFIQVINYLFFGNGELRLCLIPIAWSGVFIYILIMGAGSLLVETEYKSGKYSLAGYILYVGACFGFVVGTLPFFLLRLRAGKRK